MLLHRSEADGTNNTDLKQERNEFTRTTREAQGCMRESTSLNYRMARPPWTNSGRLSSQDVLHTSEAILYGSTVRKHVLHVTALHVNVMQNQRAKSKELEYAKKLAPRLYCTAILLENRYVIARCSYIDTNSDNDCGSDQGVVESRAQVESPGGEDLAQVLAPCSRCTRTWSVGACCSRRRRHPLKSGRRWHQPRGQGRTFHHPLSVCHEVIDALDIGALAHRHNRQSVRVTEPRAHS